MADAAPRSPRPACLTEEQLSRVRDLAAAEVPADIARHLSTCERCQERALFGAIRPARRHRQPSPLPTPTRALILLGVMIAVMVAFFFTLQQVLGR